MRVLGTVLLILALALIADQALGALSDGRDVGPVLAGGTPLLLCALLVFRNGWKQKEK